MEVIVRHSPSFAVARLRLAAGEQAKVESGAMMATSADIAIESKMQGGVMKSLKRAALGGESLFISTYTAPDGGGIVDVAAHLPGDVVVLETTPDRALFLTRGSWLASASTVELDTQWGGFKNLFGGEGGFLVRCSGPGPVVAACYGAMETWDLQPGQRMVIDTGHLVAFTEGTVFETRRITTGLMQTLKSGEGLVFEFTGPGRVVSQTRNPTALTQWLTTVLPFSRG